jgi:hypothetical protein
MPAAVRWAAVMLPTCIPRDGREINIGHGPGAISNFLPPVLGMGSSAPAVSGPEAKHRSQLYLKVACGVAWNITKTFTRHRVSTRKVPENKKYGYLSCRGGPIFVSIRIANFFFFFFFFCSHALLWICTIPKHKGVPAYIVWIRLV